MRGATGYQPAHDAASAAVGGRCSPKGRRGDRSHPSIVSPCASRVTSCTVGGNEANCDFIPERLGKCADLCSRLKVEGGFKGISVVIVKDHTEPLDLGKKKTPPKRGQVDPHHKDWKVLVRVRAQPASCRLRGCCLGVEPRQRAGSSGPEKSA